MENNVNRPLSDKSMKFCIVIHVVHDLTNDISYNAKLNRSNLLFWGKIVTIYAKNREKLENSGIKFCTVLGHILNKDTR